MNAMLDPRMVAARIHAPFTPVGWEHRLLRMTASSQGGLAIIAIRPLSVRFGRRRVPEDYAFCAFFTRSCPFPRFCCREVQGCCDVKSLLTLRGRRAAYSGGQLLRD